MEKKKTLGQASTELKAKEDNSKISVMDQQKGMQEDYLKELVICAERHIPVIIGDFYIVVITKKERLLDNVITNKFGARMSCPTPDFDQAVYKYNHNLGQIQFLWVIPAKDVCEHLYENKQIVVDEERDLLNFVLSFKDGSLFEYAKKLNNEQPDSPLLID